VRVVPPAANVRVPDSSPLGALGAVAQRATGAGHGTENGAGARGAEEGQRTRATHLSPPDPTVPDVRRKSQGEVGMAMAAARRASGEASWSGTPGNALSVRGWRFGRKETTEEILDEIGVDVGVGGGVGMGTGPQAEIEDVSRRLWQLGVYDRDDMMGGVEAPQEGLLLVDQDNAEGLLMRLASRRGARPERSLNL